jgi:hypothetical protein
MTVICISGKILNLAPSPRTRLVFLRLCPFRHTMCGQMITSSDRIAAWSSAPAGHGPGLRENRTPFSGETPMACDKPGGDDDGMGNHGE